MNTGRGVKCHLFGSGFVEVIRFSILKFSFRKWWCCSDFSSGFSRFEQSWQLCSVNIQSGSLIVNHQGTKKSVHDRDTSY